ncbi:MAG TPA: hypothetical protein PKB03_04270, partial [Baekduia sp.]|nr:hypothetical protein [Baekduia sp.]
DRYYAAGKKVVRNDAAVAEAAQWLSENEDETAMTPERLAAMEAAKAAEQAEAMDEALATPIDEAVSPQAGRRFTRS